MDRRTFLKLPVAGLPAVVLSATGIASLNTPDLIPVNYTFPPVAAGNSALKAKLAAQAGRRALTPPAGLKIDFGSLGVRITDRTVGLVTQKPRLAALADEMWHAQKQPLLDSNAGMLLWSREGSQDELLCYPNQEAMAALGGFLIKKIVLHAVETIVGEYLGPAMVLRPNVQASIQASSTERPVVVFEGADSVQQFAREHSRIGSSMRHTHYFVSLHFSATPEKGLEFGCAPVPRYAAYDLADPYCFPVKFKASRLEKDAPFVYRICKIGRFGSAGDENAPGYLCYELPAEYEA
jgi:hypothetical protein